ncbi:MAG: DNA methyltransferase [Acidobacteria bacterium]|nr:DNA methyltransferase [Acidobacteriota bacterium]
MRDVPLAYCGATDEHLQRDRAAVFSCGLHLWRVGRTDTDDMTPYYDHAGIQIWLGDCRNILPHVTADVVVTDPPYDEETHRGARTLDLETRARASNGKRGIVASARIEIDFAHLDGVDLTANLWRVAQRWALVFCSVEMLGDYRRESGEAWIRGGFWRRPDASPQITGDRPAQPGEGIAIMHRPGRKTWNGGGHHAFYEYNVVKHGRVHPTQKPLALMRELVGLYSNEGETILDPFMGSGTTLVAAKQLGRKAIGIEISREYCDIAIRRLAQEVLPLGSNEPDPEQGEMWAWAAREGATT